MFLEGTKRSVFHLYCMGKYCRLQSCRAFESSGSTHSQLGKCFQTSCNGRSMGNLCICSQTPTVPIEATLNRGNFCTFLCKLRGNRCNGYFPYCFCSCSWAPVLTHCSCPLGEGRVLNYDVVRKILYERVRNFSQKMRNIYARNTLRGPLKRGGAKLVPRLPSLKDTTLYNPDNDLI